MLVALSGEYDLGSIDDLRTALTRAKTEPDPVVDFSNVRFADSTCVVELLEVSKQRRENGLKPLTVVAGAENRLLQKVFAICGLYESCNVVTQAGQVARRGSDRRDGEDRRSSSERRVGVIVH